MVFDRELVRTEVTVLDKVGECVRLTCVVAVTDDVASLRVTEAVTVREVVLLTEAVAVTVGVGRRASVAVWEVERELDGTEWLVSWVHDVETVSLVAVADAVAEEVPVAVGDGSSVAEAVTSRLLETVLDVPAL